MALGGLLRLFADALGTAGTRVLVDPRRLASHGRPALEGVGHALRTSRTPPLLSRPWVPRRVLCYAGTIDWRGSALARGTMVGWIGLSTATYGSLAQPLQCELRHTIAAT